MTTVPPPLDLDYAADNNSRITTEIAGIFQLLCLPKELIGNYQNNFVFSSYFKYFPIGIRVYFISVFKIFTRKIDREGNYIFLKKDNKKDGFNPPAD